ncbi:hypothetical protein ABZ642_19340 [Streptomyces sp. NPDC007157]|uniref:hypothetical protein n=1 Tax=Streptomyces sp. NPDC007157 TaxID=3154681 RepID=UPI00340BFAE7
MAPVELPIGSRRQAAGGTARTREATSPFDGSTVCTVALAGTAVADPDPDHHHRKATA